MKDKMKASQAAVDLIKRFEGCKLKSYPGLEVQGNKDAPWTIGYGHCTPDIKQGMEITQEEALAFLEKDVNRVATQINNIVVFPLTQCQFDALVSWVFNLGIGNFQSSTLLRMLNEGRYLQAALEIEKWTHVGARVIGGLIARRSAEVQLFMRAPDSWQGATDII